MILHFLKLCFLVCILSLPLSLSAQPSRDLYREYFEQAGDRFLSYLDRSPDRLRAQGIAESNLNNFAISPVGAVGVMQFMPRTWEACLAALDLSAYVSPFDPHASILCGAWYMDWQMKRWNARPRTPEQRWYLGLAGYNAGLGNILKAQKECGYPLEWEYIAPCLSLVTGPRNSAETTGYVIRISRILKAL